MSKRKSPGATPGPSQSRKADDSTSCANDATSPITAATIREWGPLSVKTRNVIPALGIGRDARHVLRCLLDRARENTWGDCYPGKGELNYMTEIGMTTIKKALAELQRANVLRAEHRENGERNLSNLYHFNLEAFAAAANAMRVTRERRRSGAAPRGSADVAPRSRDDLPGSHGDLFPGSPRDLPGSQRDPKRTPNEHSNNDPSQPATQRAPRADEGTKENLPSPDTASEASTDPVDPTLSKNASRADLLTPNATPPIPSFWNETDRTRCADETARVPRPIAPSPPQERTCTTCHRAFTTRNDASICRSCTQREREQRAKQHSIEARRR